MFIDRGPRRATLPPHGRARRRASRRNPGRPPSRVADPAPPGRRRANAPGVAPGALWSPVMRRQTFFAKTAGEIPKQWHHADADGRPLGRLAVEIATVLMGKHRPTYTPHTDTGDFVVVTNGTKVAMTGRKAEQRLKMRYTEYPSGLKTETYGSVRERKPEKLI